MAALTSGRNTKRRSGSLFTLPMKGSTTIFYGGIVVIGSDGYARPGRIATSDKAYGRAVETKTNAGASSGKHTKPTV